jgi:thiosulfate reductase cytochrome b subunit
VILSHPHLTGGAHGLRRCWHSLSRPTRSASIALGLLLLAGFFEGGRPDGAWDWLGLALALALAFGAVWILSACVLWLRAAITRLETDR